MSCVIAAIGHVILSHMLQLPRLIIGLVKLHQEKSNDAAFYISEKEVINSPRFVTYIVSQTIIISRCVY